MVPQDLGRRLGEETLPLSEVKGVVLHAAQLIHVHEAFIVGPIEEETGFDKSQSKTEIQHLADFAEKISPLLTRDFLTNTWTGLRPMSYDGLPYMGPHSIFKNVFVATGHFRAGLQLSTGTADVMAKMIFNEPLDFDVSSLRPER